MKTTNIWQINEVVFRETYTQEPVPQSRSTWPPPPKKKTSGMLYLPKEYIGKEDDSNL